MGTCQIWGVEILVYRYFLREVLPQFLTTLCVLSAVLVVSQLVRLSEVLVTFGLTLENILLPFLFIILPFLSFTIPMAYLFAVLIAFSRLSSDGEFTALLAGGYSLARASRPILLVGIVLYGIGAMCALHLEPWGRRELVNFYHRKAQTELDNMLKFRMQSGIFLDNFLGFVMYAEKISPDRTRFDNVMLAPGPNQDDHNFTLLAPSGSISGSVKDGDLRMSFDYGIVYSANHDSEQTSIVKFKRAEIDLLRIFQEQIFGSGPSKNDYRAMAPGRLLNYIDKLKDKKKKSAKDHDNYLKAWFLFHQRAGLPFATVTFALFAMVLGVQDQRKGKSLAYVYALATIIGGYILTMVFKWLAESGKMDAPLAAWAPNVILLAFGGFLVYQKNRLPPSEPTLDPHNIPIVSRWLRKAKQ